MDLYPLVCPTINFVLSQNYSGTQYPEYSE
jgi:hypothetical protein